MEDPRKIEPYNVDPVLAAAAASCDVVWTANMWKNSMRLLFDEIEELYDRFGLTVVDASLIHKFVIINKAFATGLASNTNREWTDAGKFPVPTFANIS